MTVLRLALLQSAGVLGDVAANLAELDERAAEAAGAGAGLLLTPEMFLTGYELGAQRTAEMADRTAGELVPAVAEVARRHGIALLVGMPERADGQVVNSAVLVSADGEVLGHHVKTHLFGPDERDAFVPGDRPVSLFDVGGVKVAVLICYDVEFPEAVRAAAAAGAHLVAVPTAQMEPFSFIADVIIRARAWENQIYVAYANHCGREVDLAFVGLSSIVAPSGRVLAAAPPGDVTSSSLLLADVDTAAVEAGRRDNPYLVDRRLDIHPGPATS